MILIIKVKLLSFNEITCKSVVAKNIEMKVWATVKISLYVGMREISTFKEKLSGL